MGLPEARGQKRRVGQLSFGLNSPHFVWVEAVGSSILRLFDCILNERALFQANNDLHTLGASRTGIYSYSVWLFRCPLVVTVDLSAVWEGSEPWLADNMFELFLDGPCYL